MRFSIDCLTLVLVTVMLSASSVAVELPAERAERIDAFVDAFTELGMFDGTVLVDVAGDIVYRRSFGYANYEFELRHDADTRFRIASVSKGLTDAALAKMMEGDLLALDTPISEYLAEFPSAERITIRHILDHSSGIPHTNRQPWGDGSISLTTDEIIARLAKLPLDFEPGSDSRYSNGGYAVLAKIMGIIAAGSYADAMQRFLFEPLGMADSSHIADSRAPIAHLATGYEPGLIPGSRRQPRFYAVETRPGGGSLYSTADDLLSFTRAVFRDGFVPAPLQRDVMGLDENGYLSQGRSPGYVTKLYYEPDDDVIVISLSNNYAVPAGWASAIADLATGRQTRNPWPTVEVGELTIADDDPRLGRFRSSFGNFVLEHRLSPSGYLLSWDDVNRQYAALIPLADGDYLQPLYYQKCSQEPSTRIITCRMLSGDDRYTSTLTPADD